MDLSLVKFVSVSACRARIRRCLDLFKILNFSATGICLYLTIFYPWIKYNEVENCLHQYICIALVPDKDIRLCTIFRRHDSRTMAWINVEHVLACFATVGQLQLNCSFTRVITSRSYVWSLNRPWNIVRCYKHCRQISEWKYNNNKY